MKKSSTRIFVILARNAPLGVIFRRGPSKQVQLIKWHLGSDKLEYGQWFKGRIYERRCDLSPSGDFLAYFAAKNKKPLYCWTAVSKPPYLTALALWPKRFGAWGGGGLWESELTLLLNHEAGERDLMEGFHLKKDMKTRPLGEYSGRGEDDPLYHTRLLRDGWVLKDQGECQKPDWKAKVTWVYTRPQIYQKACGEHLLQMQTKGVHQQDGPWYLIDYAFLTKEGEALFTLPDTDWADWDGDGNLLFARAGKLFRLNKKNFARFKTKGDEALKEIADLNHLKFEAKAAPAKATVW